MDEQYGFRSGKSTEVNLLQYGDYLSGALEEGLWVHTLYTDFSKAFDRVDHGILVGKLHMMGISGALLSWLESYLQNRTQIVRVNGYHSNPINVPSGVPQGSHLGPLLFNIFINDIGSCFKHSNYLLFADDVKLYMKIKSIDDCACLQSDLNRLVTWCGGNGMQLNVKKCHAMMFGRSQNTFDYLYSIDGTPLEVMTEVKDLGVIFDTSLSFIPHISSIVSKALQMLGFIKRCTYDFYNTNAILVLYYALVRPYLEYASCLWSPCYEVHIRSIEQVQRKFLRYLAYKNLNLPIQNYSQFARNLGTDTLQSRRIARDLKMLFNILNGKVICPVLLGRINFHVPSRSTRRRVPFHIPLHRTNYAGNSFLSRTMSLANKYSDKFDFFIDFKSFLHVLNNCVLLDDN